jgi:hypothetical protein
MDPMVEAIELAYPGFDGAKLLEVYWESGTFKQQIAVLKVCAMWATGRKKSGSCKIPDEHGQDERAGKRENCA